MNLRTPAFALAAALLGLLAACGGGSVSSSSTPTPTTPVAPAVPATGFAYADPAGSGWRLVKAPGSTPQRLLLELVGPVGIRSRGVGFNLVAPPSVAFGAFSDGWYASDTGVFDLLNRHRGVDDIASVPEPVYFAAGVKQGNKLTVGIFQKDRLLDAKVVTSPMVRIALVFDAARAKNLKAGDALSLVIAKARSIPSDIGTMTPDGTYSEGEVLAKSRLEDIQVAVGTLTAQ